MIFGLILNLKFSSILLMPYLFVHLFYTYNDKKLFKLINLIIVSSTTFFILSVPIIETVLSPIQRSLIQSHQLKELILNNSIYLVSFFVILFLVIFITIIKIKINLKKNNLHIF